MHRGSVGLMTDRKTNAPRHVSRKAITTPGHETTQSAKSLAQRNARRQSIGHFPKREFFPNQIKGAEQKGAYKSTIKNQTPISDFENLNEIFPGKILVPVFHDIPRSRPENSARDQPKSNVVNRICFQPAKAGAVR